MGIRERREREKERRRNSIIDAAERVFFSSSMDQATMDEVAETAELSKATLYQYFGGKEDIYLAIVLRGHKVVYEMMVDAVNREEYGLDKMRAIGRAYFDFYRNYTDYFNALLYFENNYKRELDEENPYCRQCHRGVEEIMHLVKNAIQVGIDDGTIRSDLDPSKTALVLWGESIGLIQLISLKEKVIQEHFQVDPQEVIDHFFELFDYTLRAR